MAELTQHGFLFGTKLEETVEWIIGEAMRDGGSAEALDVAAHQLRGIDRFLLMLDLHIASLRMSNTIRAVQDLAETRRSSGIPGQT